MVSEITIEVGDLYENLHVQFTEKIGDEYEQAIREEIENIIHNYNQQLDRTMEQQNSDTVELETDE